MSKRNRPRGTADDRRKEAQQRRLEWLLREYDCRTVEDAKRNAGTDPTLHRLLRECGIRFED